MSKQPTRSELKNRIESLETQIDEQNRYIEALQKTEERYRAIFKYTKSGVAVYRAVDEGRDFIIEDFNSAAEKIEGATRSEIIGKRLLSAFPGVTEFGLFDVLQRVYRTGEPEHYPISHYKDHRISGWRENFVCRLPSGNVVAVYSDETVQKQNEEHLTLFKKAVEAASDAIGVSTAQGVRSYQNQAFDELFGDIGNDPPATLYVDEVQGREIFQTIMSGEQWIGEVPMRSKTGEILYVFLRAYAIKDQQGDVIGLVGVHTDMTNRKKMEAALYTAQKMESLGTLAGGIAHDFNNLLMGIQGNASLSLLGLDDTHGNFEHLKNIEEYVQRGVTLTRQLLGLARGGKYEVKPTDLNHLLRGSSEMFGQTKKEIRIHSKYQSNIWTVEVDQGQIEQVLLNLFINAWQSMTGGGSLYLETKNVTLDPNYVAPYSAQPGRYVQISVTDTGTGMDKEIQNNIFDPFFTTKAMGRGTGLGLSSAYGIIKNHSGIINVYSEPGKGSTFNMYLPASDKTAVREPKLLEALLSGTESILMIDDDPMILDVGKKLLERLGYQVFTATSGKSGLDIYSQRQSEIDLVILDMIMPDMSGNDTCKQLRAIDDHVKVILSSGYSLNGQAAGLMKDGCNGVIQKPFTVRELSHKVREILD
ncbi:MAG: response regulator [Deltaproteobacteria bacterium]|nr:response regulator [Deltaproteobacteria bacterium]